MKASALFEERMKISPLQKEWPASQTTEQTVQRLLWALWDRCACVRAGCVRCGLRVFRKLCVRFALFVLRELLARDC